MAKLDDLDLFARVVEAGGFAAAERATGIPKSRLSRRVSALETRLGGRLIERSAHSFAVTPVGQVVYRHALAMLGEAEAAEAAVTEAMGEPAGLVRISAALMTGELILAAMLADFAKLHPKVRIALSLSDRFVDLTVERFDLAIRASSAPLANSDLVARRVWESGFLTVASPEYLARAGMPDSPAALSKHDCLGLGTLDTVRRWFFQGAEFAIEPRFRIDNLVALAQAAVRGLGLAQVPDYTCHRELAAGTLVRVLEEWELPPSSVYAVYPSRRGLTAATRAVLDYLAERLSRLERTGNQA
jgi:DNA-binding transcriptional LysR family regulator